MKGTTLASVLLLIPGAASAFWQWNGDNANTVPQKIQPRVSRPSGPTNVNLFVVSRSELGVTWEPPLFNGGKSISKYLVEWDTDKLMASNTNTTSSEEVYGDTRFQITGLEEGQKYYVRVSAFGDSYSHAISSTPSFAIPSGMLPGFITDVSLAVATESELADRLRLAWSAPEVDMNGFNVLPSGCLGGRSAPDDLEAYRIRWDTHPSFSNAKTYDFPAVGGDGTPLHCCPSGSDGVCSVEIGTAVQTISIKYSGSFVRLDGELFDSGGVRIIYIGSQSKRVDVLTPPHGSNEIMLSPSSNLPLQSPIGAGDFVRIQGNIYIVSSVDEWPTSFSISSEYKGSSHQSSLNSDVISAYFTSPPSSCFDVSDSGNSAEKLRTHLSESFDDRPFDESITVSRSALTEPFPENSDHSSRIVGYEYHVTFTGQGFSSTLGSAVEDFLVISSPSSPLFAAGSCASQFISSGTDVSSQVSVEVTTKMESGSINAGETYYVQIAGVNRNGVGPHVSTAPEAEVPRSKPGLAQNCRVYAVPSSSSSLKVEWDGVYPNHGQAPSSYTVVFFDVHGNFSDSDVAAVVVSDIDETSRYSITKEDLFPGTRYKVLVTPVNELGEGAPNWFSDFDPSGIFGGIDFSSQVNYLERSCHAIPTCDIGSVDCTEADAESFTITTRSVPTPSLLQVGTYPSVSNDDRFSKDSILVSFEAPLSSYGVPTDKFLVEWSTLSSFLPMSNAGTVASWSSEVTAQYLDANREHAFGEFLIDSLDTGTQYFVRVSAHNSGGFGEPTNSVPVKPMTRPDPPYEPVLSRVTLDYLDLRNSDSGLSNSAMVGTSLLVSFEPPRLDVSNGRPDRVGYGGDNVSEYLIEWSRVSWDEYTQDVIEIYLQTEDGARGPSAWGMLSGSFQLSIDTTASNSNAEQGVFVSAHIPVTSTVEMMKTILENMPNVGEVEVVSLEHLRWQVTFLSEVGGVDVSLVVNKVVDTEQHPGTVIIAKTSEAAIPINAAYGSRRLGNLDVTSMGGRLHFAIEHLVPGTQVFVRISAGNQMGFGPRRKTAPEFSAPLIQRPDSPTSLFSEDVPPYLSIHSPTALQVDIGAPHYDGGSPLNSFLVEWDPSPTFDSSKLGDRAAFGSARTSASSEVCIACVTSFDVTTNTFRFTGNEVAANMLQPQRRIMVYFYDDAKAYLFSVLSATSSTIHVTKHLRVSSLSSMGSNLELMSSTYIINGLDTGRTYYVRVAAENGAMGTGKFVETMPPKRRLTGSPHPPTSAYVDAADKNTLTVSWSSDAYLNNPDIEGFKIERFRKSASASTSSSSFFGEPEIVQLSTLGLGLTGGSFQVYFGDFDTSTHVLLGTAKMEKGRNYAETHVDMTPYLNRGEEILVGDKQYFVGDTDLFSATKLPLSAVFSGSSGDNVAIFGRSKSRSISHDATASDLKSALEQMPYVNNVEVRREVDDDIPDGFLWFVTFTTNVGPQPSFSVDASKLIGLNPTGFSITRDVQGELPHDYDAIVVQDPSTTSFNLTDLETGKLYYVRVSSMIDEGKKISVPTVPVECAPGGMPGKVSMPHMRAFDNKAVLVSFEATAEANGAPIEDYIVEYSPADPSFSSGSVRIAVRPSHEFQRITTRAHTLPWDDRSIFTLSLGDFHGDFTVPVGSGTTVRVHNGGNVLERSTGTIGLSSLLSRGDFLLVGGVEYRVCQDVSESVPYDDNHLSLCSRDNALEKAAFISDNASNVVDKIPIFMLDTSLGASKSPSIGDAFLNSVDKSGSSNDMRGKLRRGDMIRVGHPTLGETFRVSTDLTRAFTDKVIPLSSEDDSNFPASLSFKSLQHSTYEVQSFFIRSSDEFVTLTPSTNLVSGFRIRFKSETTQTTTEGGANGCIRWDGDALQVKAELETLEGIDSVDVTREDLPAIAGGVGAGVKYYVTFTGDNVRGNVPPLKIIDVGTNGCLDSHSIGGVFGEDTAPVAVEQIEISYVPVYEVQTTIDIPYDATAADMKAAIESLSMAGSVDVSREINRHGFSWDVTFVDAPSSPFSPLLVMSANEQKLSASIDPGVSVVDLQKVHIQGTEGVPLFVRVAARNSYGTGQFVSSNPRAVEVSPQNPSEPVDVFGRAISDTEIFVEWNPPLASGGWPVTHYKIEYDTSLSFTSGKNSGPFGSISLSASAKSTVYDVQTVTVKINRDELSAGQTYYLSGTFSLSFDGQQTPQMPYNVSSERLKAALEELCNINEVSVTRSIHCSPDPSIGCMKPDGFSWLVTFMSVNNNGDQHHRHSSSLSSKVSHKLSVDGSYLFECDDVSRAVCSIGNSAVASVGTVQEIQSITVATSPFTVTIGGETSSAILIGDSLPVVEDKMNMFSRNGVGKIAVTCPSCVGDIVNSGDSLLLHFMSFRGDVPQVILSDSHATVSEIIKGVSQFVVGRSTYSSVISNLSSMSDWYVRVFAYNGIGGGIPSLISSPLRLSAAPPQVPENVVVETESSTSLRVSWDRPRSIGGVELRSFVLEYDTSPTFTSSNGSPAGRLSVTETDADTSIGLVAEAFPYSSDPNLRLRIMLDDASLITDETVAVGAELLIEQQKMIVTSINQDNCGVTCLTMDSDYTGTKDSGMKIYSGFDAKEYAFAITGLNPGVPYFVRVAATNEKSTGPFSFVGYPFTPVSFAPFDVPSAISWASLSAVSSDGIRLDYGRPLSENGSPASKYHVEIATATGDTSVEFRPQILSITTEADTAVSGFMELSIGYEDNHDLLVSTGDDEPSLFFVEAGSRWVDTLGDDLTSTLHPKETIVIANERVEVAAVHVDRIELKETHIRGTNGNYVSGYRKENYIGSAIITSGSNTLVETNGKNLETLLRPGDVIQVYNDVGNKEYLTVTSITGSTVAFTPSFDVETVSVSTPIHSKTRVIVPANASSAVMKAAIETLSDVGSVDVERQGPNSSDGFTWLVTFSSHMGADSCFLPSWCLSASVEASDYIKVDGLTEEINGNYVRSSTVNGRPRYELLGKSSFIQYDSSNKEWSLYSTDTFVASSAASSQVSVPLGGWTNGAMLTQSKSSTNVLFGTNAITQVAIIQSGVEPSYTNIVYSAHLEITQHEVQEIELLSDKDDLSGTFELSLGSSSNTVIFSFDESVDDFTTKLQSSSLIGRVNVDKIPSPKAYGSIWTITFLSNLGDVPRLQHNGILNLRGTNVSLTITEKVKGRLGPQHVVAKNLDEGRMYTARVSAGNDAGFGPYTSVARIASSPPESPSLSLGIVTKSSAEIMYTEPNPNGGNIQSYKFEWTSTSFLPLTKATARIACSDGSDILGSFKFIYGVENEIRSEKTVPIDIGSTSDDISLALSAMKSINDVEVSVVTNSSSELEWKLTFPYDNGQRGLVSIDTESLRCQSEDQTMLESETTIESDAQLPPDYGSSIILSGHMCGGVSLEEFSSVQYLTLSVESGPASSGSFQLMLDNISTRCIPFDASETQLKAAIQDLDYVGDIDVIATGSALGGVTEYTIVFKGDYPFGGGDWPALSVNLSQFGKGDCDPFVGGVNHKATILPVRDETTCVIGSLDTVAVVASSLTPIVGSFSISCGDKSSEKVSVDSSASEMKSVLSALLGSTEVVVTKHVLTNPKLHGATWAVSYPRNSDDNCGISIDDTFVTGKNANVNTYPILIFKTSNDSSGDFRIVIDGESTSPISHQATHEEVLHEMHKLDSIGFVEMLGSAEVEGESSLTDDYSMIVKAHTADLGSVNIIPERNWRGTAPRVFYKPPSGMPPRTFFLKGLNKQKAYVVRAFARNSDGYGPPSNLVKIVPASTTPSAPTSVSLSF
ncbi:hypothetical protein ACHAXM_009254 [Skeletonema potamos]